ncbi:uncharacterized protein LOC141801923 isoform X2 [Halichoeres trimaculatus]|uniref:uncharacterized protein LOC141801923 isoform X2 n=1 Tax=Halichoeres trimaculatus TaxID=147232 RepID=UPI003D9F73D5
MRRGPGFVPLRAMEGETVPGRNFFVEVSGITNDAHLSVVRELQHNGQNEVKTVAESDYILLFCPIASRVGTDISEALERAPGNRPVIMVVMHHTFNPDHVIAESRRQVADPNVRLVVDTLFYKGHLLDSKVNDVARSEIQRILGVHAGQPGRGSSMDPRKWVEDKSIVKTFLAVFLVIVAVVIVIVVTGECLKKNQRQP